MNEQNRKLTAVVTGATGSIGKAIINELINKGYHIIAIARNIDKLKALQNESKLGYIDIYNADITNLDDIKRMSANVSKKYSQIDLLVNSAGGGPIGGIKDISDETWINNINLKLVGYIRISKLFLPKMYKADYGRIINIVGTFGKQPSPLFIVGSVINASLLAFTKALSLELEETKITVNAINPGAVKSTLWQDTIDTIVANNMESAKFLTSDLIRLVTPDEIAKSVLFLANKDSQSINGTTLNVDNGAYSGF